MKDSFERDGYLIAEDCFPRLYLSRLAEVLWVALADGADCDESLDSLIMKSEAIDHQKVYSAGLCAGSSLVAQELIGRSQLIPILCDLLDVAPQYLHAMPLHLAIQLPYDAAYLYLPHQESSFYPAINNILNIWFPITRKSSEEGGTIGVIPGSHVHGKRANRQERGMNGFLQIVPDLHPGEIERTIPIEMEPGNAFIFHADTVHSSYPNRSGLPRLNGILRIVNMAEQKQVKPLYKALSWGDA